MQLRKVVSWLSMHNFPYGVVSFADGISTDPLRHKMEYLKGGTGYKKVISKTEVLWIRIHIGSVFSSFVDPDPYSENGSGFTHVNIG